MPVRYDVLAQETVVAPALIQELLSIHRALDRFWVRVDRLLPGGVGRGCREEFATAVGEIATNIARHAYSRAGTGSMRLRLRLYQDRVEACFTDRGLPFVDPQRTLQVPGDDVMELPEDGFGLAMARAFLDRLDYRRTSGGANSWRLVKRLAA